MRLFWVIWVTFASFEPQNWHHSTTYTIHMVPTIHVQELDARYAA